MKRLELWGNHWEDIAVCGGMVSTAGAILLVVFIPKVIIIKIDILDSKSAL